MFSSTISARTWNDCIGHVNCNVSNHYTRCASPGGKTTHIATLMKDKGRLIALDKLETKVQPIRELCKLQGITCVEAIAMDSAKILMHMDKLNINTESFDR